jgi:hypothetical protein
MDGSWAPAARQRMNCREFTEFLHEYLFGI